jgi:hypothetical protein
MDSMIHLGVKGIPSFIAVSGFHPSSVRAQLYVLLFPKLSSLLHQHLMPFRGPVEVKQILPCRAQIPEGAVKTRILIRMEENIRKRLGILYAEGWWRPSSLLKKMR